MAKKDFADFVKRQQVAPENAFDKEKHLREWIDHLGQLYAFVEKSLRDFIDLGQVDLQYKPISIFEELLGEYQVNKLQLKIGRSEISFVPVGTFLIGSRGRVDATGSRGVVRFVLTVKGSNGPVISFTVLKPGEAPPPPKRVPAQDWEWAIVLKGGRPSYLPLTQERLMDAIIEIADV